MQDLTNKTETSKGLPTHSALEAHNWNDEKDFRRAYPIVWLGTLSGPPLIALSIVAYFFIAHGWGSAAKLVSTAVFSFLAAGKFIILGGGIEHLEQNNFYSSEQLFALVFTMDTLTVCFLVFHLGFLFKLPRMGKNLQAVADNGHMMLEAHPWMRRATFIGLVIFVAVPLAMTGSVGGSILGRLLGMSRSGTFVGVMIGNLLGSSVMYFGSGMLRNILKKDDPMLLIGGIIVVGIVCYILVRRYQQTMKAAVQKRNSA
jgi:uncharacterized membrane protein